MVSSRRVGHSQPTKFNSRKAELQSRRHVISDIDRNGLTIVRSSLLAKIFHCATYG